jgi:hypothetical protein
VIRTVWLGLSFLVILGGVGSFKFAFGSLDAANASDVVRPNSAAAVVTPRVQEAEVDQWRGAYAFAEIELAKASQAPAEISRMPVAIVTPPVVSRQCRAPAASVIRQARDQKPKRKRANNDAVADNKSDEAAEPKACQLADFDAIRAALHLPTGCRT